jgi:NAD+--dinitrogen-reductase ADP-D-ribosyltransferase
VELAGVREGEGRLFQRLDRLADPADRVAAFTEYLPARFQFDPNGATAAPGVRQACYLQFLRRWGADSNGRSGAVLKSWVESRFGLRATYHGGVLSEDPAAREKYDRDRNWSGAMGVGTQLDLVYAFCQYELARRYPGERWMTLYRGTHDPQEYAIRSEGALDVSLVELNSLSSFTSDREVAWEFGSSVWEVRIPLAKILFFGGMLPSHFPESEEEHLVLGGEYRVLGGEYRVKKILW